MIVALFVYILCQLSTAYSARGEEKLSSENIPAVHISSETKFFSKEELSFLESVILFSEHANFDFLEGRRCWDSLRGTFRFSETGALEGFSPPYFSLDPEKQRVFLQNLGCLIAYNHWSYPLPRAFSLLDKYLMCHPNNLSEKDLARLCLNDLFQRQGMYTFFAATLIGTEMMWVALGQMDVVNELAPTLSLLSLSSVHRIERQYREAGVFMMSMLRFGGGLLCVALFLQEAWQKYRT